MAEALLYNHLMDYGESGIYPFHMPGHKLGKGLESFPLLKLDLTEISGMDNLYEAEGVIAKAQELAAATFAADETVFLVNGSTTGVIASVLGVCNPGDELIIARNSHCSAYHGMILGDIIPRYINPQVINEYGLLGGISTEDVREAVKSYPDAKAVFITSPTYEGFSSDIKKIADLCHSYGKLLIVDEAHGAHFNFHSAFPKSAVTCGADIVIQSLHKTLPALTQSALLHFKGNRLDKNRVKQMIRLIQTSSPSYILMGMMDWLRSHLDERKDEIFNTYIENLINFRDDLKDLKKIKLLEKELNHRYAIEEIDISRLVFYTGRSNKSGLEIDKILRDHYKIQMELSSEIHFLGISTIVDTKEAFDYLAEVLIDLDKKLMINEEKTDTYNVIYPISNVKISPREAFYSKKEKIPLEKSEGKISAEFVVLYPPGIPILSPGEEITRIHIEQIIKGLKKKQIIDVII